MSVQLNIPEMTEALRRLQHPQAYAFTAMAEALGSAMATAIGAALDCDVSEATDQGVGFAGITAQFLPKYAAQPCPELLSDYDDGGVPDWDNVATESDLPPMPDRPAAPALLESGDPRVDPERLRQAGGGYSMTGDE